MFQCYVTQKPEKSFRQKISNDELRGRSGKLLSPTYSRVIFTEHHSCSTRYSLRMTAIVFK